ncbi:MAG: hypothetical protein AAF705_19655, partial [Bacteroidota bacterium]
LEEQGQASTNCISTNAKLAGINLDQDGSSAELIKTDVMESGFQDLNPSTKRRVALFGQHQLQKLMHQHKSENCACTMPKNEEAIKKKISTPNWLRAIQWVERD